MTKKKEVGVFVVVNERWEYLRHTRQVLLPRVLCVVGASEAGLAGQHFMLARVILFRQRLLAHSSWQNIINIYRLPKISLPCRKRESRTFLHPFTLWDLGTKNSFTTIFQFLFVAIRALAAILCDTARSKKQRRQQIECGHRYFSAADQGRLFNSAFARPLAAHRSWTVCAEHWIKMATRLRISIHPSRTTTSTHTVLMPYVALRILQPTSP